MGDLILTEILQGFRSDKDHEKAKSYLSDFPFKAMGGYDVAVKSAQNYRLLRKKGITVRKTIDSISIAGDNKVFAELSQIINTNIAFWRFKQSIPYL